MSAPKTSVEARKWRADMRSHAMNWREKSSPDNSDILWQSKDQIDADAAFYLKMSKDYRDMAISAESRQMRMEPEAMF